MRLSVQMPLLVTLSLVLLASGCGSGGNEQSAPPGDEARNETQLPSSPSGGFSVTTPSGPSCTSFDVQGGLLCHFSGLTTRERRVIRDAQAWAAAWAQAMSNVSPQPALPEVDFGREMVVLAVMGEKSSGGYSISVKDVTPRDGALEVTVVEVSPGQACGVAAALSQPFTAVRVPRTDGEVRFIEQQVVRDCAQ